MNRSVFNKAKINDSAVSPLIGVIMMLFLTLLFAGITFSVVYDDGFSSLNKAPMAFIEVKSVEGGVPDNARYIDNYIILLHRSGEPLQADATQIIITGQGSAFTGTFFNGEKRYGDVFVNYADISFSGKENEYALENPAISDGLWSAGERLILNGGDGFTHNTSVFVRVNGFENTSNNYGLKEGGDVTIKVFDRNTHTIIAECSHEVVPVA
ncbi:type IV pilin N-terminal domain-containing protein [Methanolobus sp. ZRKC3]|uniref:type IV pilin n=1 Tax=Methanolobus sp. ZRKC3 TaxID=3125786 RepID=UPI0032520A14